MTLDDAKREAKQEAEQHGLVIHVYWDNLSEAEDPDDRYEYAPDHAIEYLSSDYRIVETYRG